MRPVPRAIGLSAAALLIFAGGAAATSGARQVKDIWGGPDGSSPADLTEMGGTLFFSATDTAHGRELWRVDAVGTPVLVKDIRPGPASSNPRQLTLVGRTLFFSANDGTAGIELWKSDGSSDGTTMVMDIVSGAESSRPGELAAVDDMLLFAASDPATGRELWRSDGTRTGTALVVDVTPGPIGTWPKAIMRVGATILFVASPDLPYRELWKTDGSASATRISYVSPESRLLLAGDSIYFAGLDPFADHGVELYRSDGTHAGTEMVRDIVPGSQSSYPGYRSDLALVGGIVYFKAVDPLHGWELWRSDGTRASTTLVSDVVRGPADSRPVSLTEFDGILYFGASNRTSDAIGLWRSDGSGAGTVLVRRIRPGIPKMRFGGPPFIVADRVFYFVADDGVHGFELWVSDGTRVRTRMVLDVNPDPVGDGPTSVVAAVGGVYFTADDGSHGSELWWSDGTPSGTTLVADVDPGASSSAPADLVYQAT